MLKSNTVLGVEIGFSTLKVIELEKTRSGLQIVNYAVASLSRSAEEDSSDDATLKSREVSELLKRIIREKKIKARSASVAVSNKSVFTKFVKLPFGDHKNVAKLVAFEAQQQIPFPLEDVSWDYQIIGKSKEDEYEVLIAAIKQTTLQEVLSVFKGTGITPVLMDIGAMSLYNALLKSQIKPEEKVIVLDIGATPATLIVHHAGGYWVRTLPYSSVSLTHVLMKSFNISFEEAESLKFNGMILSEMVFEGETNDVNVKINQTITQSAQKLHTEVARSLNFYRTQFDEFEPDRLILCGGGSHLDDLRAFLGSRMKVTVDFADPLSGLQYGRNVNPQEINEVGYIFSGAVGLAMRQVESSRVELNLMTVATDIKTSMAQYFRYYYMIVIVIMGVLGFGLFELMKQNDVLQKRYESVHAEHSRLDGLKTKIQQVKGSVVKSESELKILQKHASGRSYWFALYLALNRKVPETIRLSEFTPTVADTKNIQSGAQPNKADSIVVNLSGVADSSRDLDVFKEGLLKLVWIEKIDVTKASFVGNTMEFILLITLNPDTKVMGFKDE